MTLSYRIIKNLNSNESHVGVEIATKNRTSRQYPTDWTREEGKPSAEKKRDTGLTEEEKKPLLEEFRQSLEQEKLKVLSAIREEATNEAEILKSQAKAQGYEEGFVQGMKAGEEKVRKEWEEPFASAMEKLREVEIQIEEYREAQTENLIRLAGKMAEKIVNHHIDTNSDAMVDMIKEVLQEYKKGGILTISCSRKNVRRLKENAFELKKINGDIEYIIVENPLIQGNTINLEYENQMIDMDIAQQVQAMVQDLIAMEG